MLFLIKEAGFISEEMFKDLTARQRWIRSLFPKAEAYARKEGVILRGKPIVKFSKFPTPAGANPSDSREVLVLSVYEKRSAAAAGFSSSAD